MSRRGLLLMVTALALCAAWAVYAQGTGPSATGTPSATEQCVGCTTPACEPAGCSGDCTACPGCADCSGDCTVCSGCADKHNDGVCDTAGTCAKRANGGCGGQKGCGRRCSSL
jgi:hypothetical protein